MKRVDIFLKKYYTDWHEVDENMVTIVNQSGMWTHGSVVGIAFRTMNDTPTSSPDYVASSDISKIDYLIHGLSRCRRRQYRYALLRWKFERFRRMWCHVPICVQQSH